MPLRSGYLCIQDRGSPFADKSGSVYVHRMVAGLALGKPLPLGAEVHHVDGNRLNNDPRNLVICENHAYHALLEQRTRAYDACGNPDWRMCVHCEQYDAPENLSNHGSSTFKHRLCHTIRERERRAAKKGVAA